MGSPYGQFCPVSKAMELLDERWTLLVVRELVSGTEHFNDLRRGLPRMSPTLLTKRLQQLSKAGLVERVADGGTSATYPPPPAASSSRSSTRWGCGELAGSASSVTRTSTPSS